MPAVSPGTGRTILAQSSVSAERAGDRPRRTLTKALRDPCPYSAPMIIMRSRGGALVQILAIRSWQLKHDGQFPDRLDALVPEELPSLPNDPYSDRPFGYIPWNGRSFFRCIPPWAGTLMVHADSRLISPARIAAALQRRAGSAVTTVERRTRRTVPRPRHRLRDSAGGKYRRRRKRQSREHTEGTRRARKAEVRSADERESGQF